MRNVDPFFLSKKQPKDTLIFAMSQNVGARQTQEDMFANYNDECFVLADGVGGLPHGKEAAELTAETAIWGYKQIRLRPYYWEDKKLFMKRIFRTVNIAVWQKHRETGFNEGLASTLLVLMVSTRTIWLGNVGDGAVFIRHRDGNLEKLTREDRDKEGNLLHAVGLERYGIIPHFATGEFIAGDSIVMLTDGIADYVTEKDIVAGLKDAGDTSVNLKTTADGFINLARKNGSTDNMTAAIIKRIPQAKTH